MGKTKKKPAGCESCSLNGRIKVYGEGPDKAPLVIVGEGAGQQELILKRPFVGPSGSLLTAALNSAGIKREDVYITNAVLCMTTPPRTPKASEVECCRNRLLEEIKSRSPKVIIALGKIATKALLGIYKPISDIRGSLRQATHLNAYVIPTYHPAAILRNPRLHRDFVADINKAKHLLSNPETVMSNITVNYKVIESPADAEQFLDDTDKYPVVALDVETGSRGELLCVGFSLADCEAVVVPADIFNSLAENFDCWLSKKLCVGHNLKFDLRVLRGNGVYLPTTGGDTMLQSYVLNPLVGGHGLKQLVREVLDYYDDYSEEVADYYRTMELCPKDVLYRYNAHDAALTLLIYKKHLEMLDDTDNALLHNILYPASDALLDMEDTGVAVDIEYLNKLRDELGTEIGNLVMEMQKIAGVNFNPRAQKQLLDVLYNKLELPIPGRLSTDKKAIALLEKVCDHPIISLLQKYRDRYKFYSTYVLSLLEAADSDGRVRTTFNLHTTATGRLSSSRPLNLQNIPRTPEARNIFIATPGYTLVEADLAQAEVRGWAWYSRDEALKKAIIESGVDVHTATACLMFGLKPEEVTKEQRTYGKRLTFGTLYGMDAKTLAADLGVSIQYAQELQTLFFKAYKRGRQWIAEQQARVRRDGMFITPFGRKLRFAYNPNDPSEINRTAVNYPIQCLHPATPVLTINGYKPIASVRVGDKVWTGKTYANVVGTGRTVKPEYEVVLSTGGVIYASPDHLFRTADGCWTPVKELKAGTTLLYAVSEAPGGIVPDSVAEGANYNFLQYTHGKYYEKEHRLEVPNGFSLVDMAWLLGAFVGDGTYANKKRPNIVSLAIGYSTPEILDKVTTLLDELGVYYRVRTRNYRGSPSYWVVTVSNGPFRKWLLKLGLEPRTAPFKEVPAWLFTAPPDYRRAFLAGLFDSDGGITGNAEHGFAVTFTTVSKKLADGVHLLLTSLGCRSTIQVLSPSKCGKRTPYRVRVYPKDVGILNLPLIAERKARLMNVVAAYNGLRRVEHDGYYKVNVISACPTGREIEMVDICVDDPEHSFVVYNVVTHNSLCSDIALSGLIKIHRMIRAGKLGITRLLLTVHDSVLVETKEDPVEIARAVKEAMGSCAPDDWIAFEADAKYGQRWGSMEEITG